MNRMGSSWKRAASAGLSMRTASAFSGARNLSAWSAAAAGAPSVSARRSQPVRSRCVQAADAAAMRCFATTIQPVNVVSAVHVDGMTVDAGLGYVA